LKDFSTKHHVFIIGAVWVEPKSSAAGSRMLQLIHLFLEQGWKVTFGTTSTKNTNSMHLSELGVKEVNLKLNDSSFDILIKDLNPTIIVFDRFMTEEQFGWRAAKECPNALRILDTEDLHCLRKTRHEALKKGDEFSNDMLLNSDIAKRELAAIYRSDISLIISAFEMKLLKEIFKVDESLLHLTPFFLDRIGPEKQQSWKPFKERKHFISIGNFLHDPNMDATVQLKKHVWKLIRKEIPDAELHIYGAYPTQQALQFHNGKEGFFVHGFVEDADEAIENSRVLLAPLRFGAGIKGKLTDAMRNGTPSVTTQIGAEGMHDNLPWNGFIEDDREAFTKKATELYLNQKLWDDSQSKGVVIINSLYQKDKIGATLINAISLLFDRLQEHRKRNFIGTMLQHHIVQSTKYMSKWIEEKNRNQSKGAS